MRASSPKGRHAASIPDTRSPVGTINCKKGAGARLFPQRQAKSASIHEPSSATFPVLAHMRLGPAMPSVLQDATEERRARPQCKAGLCLDLETKCSSSLSCAECRFASLLSCGPALLHEARELGSSGGTHSPADPIPAWRCSFRPSDAAANSG